MNKNIDITHELDEEKSIIFRCFVDKKWQHNGDNGIQKTNK